MNVIVTNNMIEYKGFMKLKTLKEVLNIKGTIDFLVYHKSNETRENKVEYLTRLKSNVKTFIYIRGRDSLEQAVQMIIVGSGGKYFDDEFFLENSEELNKLIKGLDEVTAIAELGGINVLSDFFSRYLKNGSTGFNQGYLAIVKEAVSGMITEYKRKDLELLQISETATEIFSNTAEILSKVESERESLKNIVSSLESAKSQGAFASTSSSTTNTNNVFFFPRVSYLKDKKIVRIKELGNCPYLTSFMLGFRLYLERIKYVRAKLIFIYPVGEQYEDIYKDFKWVNQGNSKTMQGYYNNIVFTNFPNRDVITKLLDDSDYDVFIVVDRSKSYKDHILNSKGNNIKYCVSGENSMKKNAIKSSSCFSTRGIKNTLFTIPTFKDYPREIDQRERLYLRECIRQYDTLNTIRGL